MSVSGPRLITTAGSRVGTWECPEPDWLPLHLASFHFFPGFATPGAEWKRQMIALTRIPSSSQMRVIEYRDHVFVVTNGDVQLEIDASSGFFSLADVDHVRRPVFPRSFGYSAPPREFLFEAAECEHEPRYAREVSELYSLALETWGGLMCRLDEALLSGHAQIVGRKHSPLEEFSIIAIDQWAHFTPVGPENPRFFEKALLRTALGPSGSVIYSPHVMPLYPELCTDAESKQEKVARQRRELTDEIRTKVASSPKRRTMTKGQIFTFAKLGCAPDLTQNDVLVCREKAIEDVPGAALIWNAPGAPKRSV